MGRVFFFTDLHLLDDQVATQDMAFGPTLANPQTEFRLTSMHSASSDPKAYAITGGAILAQEDSSDPTLLNLILKPNEQGEATFASIKYIIYRGILKNSLVDAAGTGISTPIQNDLAQNIVHTQESLNEAFDRSRGNAIGTTVHQPSSNALGIHFTASASPPDQRLDTSYLDSVFIQNTNDFQRITIFAGDSIGTFNGSSFGIEILIDSLGFGPTFGMARLHENRLSVSNLPSNPTPAQRIGNLAQREVILNYLDPAAFYGLHIHSSVWYYDSNGNKEKKSGATIFNDIVSKFSNKDAVYLDIRNENGHSIDYYGNYGSEVKLTCEEYLGIPPADTPHGTEGWPIKILRNADFIGVNNSTNNSNKNILRLSLPLGDNNKPLVYYSFAALFDEFPKLPKRQKKFEVLDFGSGNWCRELRLGVPNIGNQNSTQIVAYYVKIYYIRRLDSAYVPANSCVVYRKDYLDNLFSISHLPILPNFGATTNYATRGTEVFFDGENEIGYCGMVELGVSVDSFKTLFFVTPRDTYIDRRSKKVKTRKLLGGSTYSDSAYLNLGEIYQGLCLRKRRVVQGLANAIDFLEIGEENVVGSGENGLCQFVSLCLANSELSSMIGALGNFETNLHSVSIRRIVNSEIVDVDGGSFQEISLGLSGMDVSGFLHEVTIAGVLAYSTLGYSFSTELAATSENTSVENLELDLKFMTSGENPLIQVYNRVKVYREPNIPNIQKSWVLYSLSGAPQVYGLGECDYQGNVITGIPIRIPAGNRIVVVSGSSRSSFPLVGGSRIYYRVLTYHFGRIREGYLHEYCILNHSANDRVNKSDLKFLDDLEIVIPFINDSLFETYMVEKLVQGDIDTSNHVISYYGKLSALNNSVKAKIQNLRTRIETNVSGVKAAFAQHINYDREILPETMVPPALYAFMNRPAIQSLAEEPLDLFCYMTCFPSEIADRIKQSPNVYPVLDMAYIRQDPGEVYSGDRFQEYTSELRSLKMDIDQSFQSGHPIFASPDYLYLAALTSVSQIPNFIRIDDAAALLTIAYNSFPYSTQKRLKRILFSATAVDQSMGFLDSNHAVSVMINELNMTVLNDLLYHFPTDTHHEVYDSNHTCTPGGFPPRASYSNGSGPLGEKLWCLLRQKVSFTELIPFDHLEPYQRHLVPPSTPAGYLSVDNTIHASLALISLFFRSPEKGVIYLDHQFSLVPQ